MALPPDAVRRQQSGAQEAVQKAVGEHFVRVPLRQQNALHVQRIEEGERGHDGDPDADTRTVSAKGGGHVVREN